MVAFAAALAVLGVTLLHRSATSQSPSALAAATPRGPAARSGTAAASPRLSREPRPDAAPMTPPIKPSTPSPSSVESPTASTAYAELPPAGSGPAADAAIQRALEAASPVDLPAMQERAAVAAGRRVWLAEVTGAGRDAFGRYFAAAPATGVYTRVRIQAAVARRDSGGGATVRLVWAGADPGGTYAEDRTGTVHLRKEDGAWIPVD
jgi:hypothetical protein